MELVKIKGEFVDPLYIYSSKLLPTSSALRSEWTFIRRNERKYYELQLSLTMLVKAQTIRIIYGCVSSPFKRKK